MAAALSRPRISRTVTCSRMFSRQSFEGEVMMRVTVIGTGLVLLASTAMAQPPAAGQTLTVASSIQRGYNAVKMNLTQEAEKMAEADYSFKPSSMPEMRTFGQLFAHVATSQFGTCATVKGVPNPNMGKNLEA